MRARRVWIVVGVCLVALAFLALRGSGLDVPNPIAVKHEDLVQTIEVEGELAAVRSIEIGVPPVGWVQFKISFLIPEGTAVKKDQAVLGFDTAALHRQLIEKQAEYQDAAKRVEQKQIELRMKLLELEQQSAQAVAELGKAQLKAQVPPDVQQRIELEKARFDYKGRERDLENLAAQRRATESLGQSEIGSLRSKRDQAQGQLDVLQGSIVKMTVKAPQDGIVIYRTNWQGEKKKVGDSTWFGETVLSLPDLAEMRAEGFVDEADGGMIAEGQAVTLHLEARPDLDIPGQVRKVGRTVRQRSWRTPVKVFKVDVALPNTDPTVMRPAMRFRGEIETARIRNLLLVPRQVVFLRDGGPIVWARRALRWTEVRVRLGRSSRRQIEVIEGLTDGDQVSPIDLAASAAAPRQASGGARP